MATKSQSSTPDKRPTLRDAHRQLRLAIHECQELLDRTSQMLRESQQDNDPPRR